ncbi:MAG: CHAD domain-containing protein [Actinobacteria bacterium]|nr:MAG: CHAD domain-containing protein [Actinomycetota bacterium]
MAKARPVQLHPGEPFAAAAARVVTIRAQEVFDHSPGVLDTTDIERVHDMRVATRRLRAVLEIFAPCFPKADFRPVLREVKELADVLGERRDPDVQIEALEEVASAGPAGDRRALGSLIGELRAEQARANGRLERALQKAERRRLAERLAQLAEAAVAEAA